MPAARHAIAAAFAALAAGCARAAPPVPTSTHAAVPPPPPQVAVPTSGPHSPLADVDLPAGATFAGNSSLEESWKYRGTYDDTVAFLTERFAAGTKYDAAGATSWRGLPPCYSRNHESPPGGWVTGDSTRWVWADADKAVSVRVFRPGNVPTADEIVIDYSNRDNSLECNRQ